jgi:hypothetical protein
LTRSRASVRPANGPFLARSWPVSGPLVARPPIIHKLHKVHPAWVYVVYVVYLPPEIPVGYPLAIRMLSARYPHAIRM